MKVEGCPRNVINVEREIDGTIGILEFALIYGTGNW
jgi:hypothetical protein